MKLGSVFLCTIPALISCIIAAPTSFISRQFKLPTCGTELCLAPAGIFDGCTTDNLACLCSLPQDEVSRYVEIVQPCLDGDEGRAACTDGAIYQYKDLLKEVCSRDDFGNKMVEFSASE